MRHLQVETDVGIARREQQRTLVVEYGTRHLVDAIVCTGKIVIEFATDTVLQQFLIVLDGLLVVALGVGTIGIGLGRG